MLASLFFSIWICLFPPSKDLAECCVCVMCAVIVLWCIVLIRAAGTGAGGKGPVRFLFICSVCLDICLGKDERIALHRNQDLSHQLYVCGACLGGHTAKRGNWVFIFSFAGAMINNYISTISCVSLFLWAKTHARLIIIYWNPVYRLGTKLVLYAEHIFTYLRSEYVKQVNCVVLYNFI